jgi:hypothetical protein
MRRHVFGNISKISSHLSQIKVEREGESQTVMLKELLDSNMSTLVEDEAPI